MRFPTVFRQPLISGFICMYIYIYIYTYTYIHNAERAAAPAGVLKGEVLRGPGSEAARVEGAAGAVDEASDAVLLEWRTLSLYIYIWGERERDVCNYTYMYVCIYTYTYTHIIIHIYVSY